ncbi:MULTISPECIES: hypothetical protein [unclassified Pseudomonas]|uniref:hypothetical protein n=1 Tax=unclassified Pseudomonas TaxID=196821 RepID=UPI001B31F385|nr:MULTISPECIES: hypothetical protein [unclassified Pseudomonas]MBP5945875.1 hypothetical protein [Pseudomonas sp. P9(2020)]MBZ9564015.1 hypothetical protein [Pseudomonas sp. P116]
MSEKFLRFDVKDHLTTSADLGQYIKGCEIEDSGDGQLNRVALRDVKQTIRARIESDSDFAQAMRIEAATLIYNGEIELGRRLLKLLQEALRHQTARRFFTYRP